jgi:hypothetical protein
VSGKSVIIENDEKANPAREIRNTIAFMNLIILAKIRVNVIFALQYFTKEVTK